MTTTTETDITGAFYFRCGNILPNGAILIHSVYMPSICADEGGRWMVLARVHHDEWATWESDLTGRTYWGSYFFDLAAAVADLNERSGPR